MVLTFDTGKLQKACASPQAMRAEWGTKMAAKLVLRISQIEAAANLSEIARVPAGRFHEYGDKAGRMSLDLVHPQRLLFVPDHDPVPTKPDGGVDLTAVTQVRVLGITDPH